MPGTIAELRRSLMARVKGLEAVEIQIKGPFHVKILAHPNRTQSSEDLARQIQHTLADIKVIGVQYEVIITNSVSPRTNDQSPHGRFRLASLSTDQTISGIREALVRLIPSLGRLVVKEDFSTTPPTLQVWVACQDGTVPNSLIQQAQSAMKAVGFAGLPFSINPLQPHDRRNDLASAGFIIPRRETRITKLAEEEEETFSNRIQQLTTKSPPKLPLVDDFQGSKVLCTISLRGASPISCFLPIYDRIYAVMHPETTPIEGDYYLRHFGLKEADFLLYCRRGKIIPIFKFGLGAYPEKVSKTFIEDPSLVLMGGRDLDYIAARYAWQETAHLRLIRDDRSLSQALFEATSQLAQTHSSEPPTQLVRNLLLQMLRGAEAFEGEMWRKGHLALPRFSPAAAVPHIIDALPLNKGAGLAAYFDTHSSTLHLSMAQAFGASLHTGLVQNEPLLVFCAKFFSQNTDILKQEQTTRIGEILKALEVAYSERIPASDYMEVFDAAETRRMRAMIASILQNPDGSSAIDAEIRERVHAFNNGVRRLDRWAINTADVDILGDLAKGGGVATGNAILQSLLSLTGLKTAKHLWGLATEHVIDDTAIGGALDRVRGAIHNIPAQSVRIYRIQGKLKKTTKNKT